VRFLKLKIDNEKLLKNVSWLLVTEVAAKASRLLVIIVLAANVDAVTYGTIMLALGCHEVLKLVLRSGAGMQIVQCSEEQLSSYAKNGAVLQWVICCVLCVVQMGLAYPLSLFYGNTMLTELLVSMAGVYLLYPLVSINVFLVQRAGNMRFFSLRNAACITAENISIAVFAFFDCGAMSVVYGKWVYASLWVAFFYFAPVERFGFGFQRNIFLLLVKTSGQLFSTELIRSFRTQLDVLLGAKLLSPELFGLFSFSKSAGVGLSQSLVNAYNSALYPYLCLQHRNFNLKNSVRWVYFLTLLICSIFVIQALSVSWYVPLIFEQQWQQNHLVVMMLCLTAIPTIIIDTHCNMLRSQAAYRRELNVRIFCLLLSATGILLVSSETPESLALTILITGVAGLSIFLPLNYFNLFNDNNTQLAVRSHSHE
jgi:PST family polysaccharide transporter